MFTSLRRVFGAPYRYLDNSRLGIKKKHRSTFNQTQFTESKRNYPNAMILFTIYKVRDLSVLVTCYPAYRGLLITAPSVLISACAAAGGRPKCGCIYRIAAESVTLDDGPCIGADSVLRVIRYWSQLWWPVICIRFGCGEICSVLRVLHCPF